MGLWGRLFGKSLNNKKNKPSKSELRSEEGADNSMEGGVRTIKHPSVAIGLTPERLAALLVGANEGNTTDYLTLAEEMEERDLHYGGVLSTRKNAVVKIGIEIESATEDAKDEMLADDVREMFEQMKYRLFAADLLDALGKGYSAVEIIWDTTGKKWYPKELKWRDPRFFQFDQDTLSELRLRDLSDPINGLELSPYKWVVHYPKIKTGIPIRGGLARLASFAHMAKSYSLKDWVSFAEVFGMPIRVGKYPAGAGTEDQRKLLMAVANIGTDAAAVIPETMMIDYIMPSNSGVGGAVFGDLADYLDKQVSKGVLGQTMTTDNGGSLAQAKVHEQVREDIIEADAANLAETIDGFIRVWVELNYGPQAKYPRARIRLKKKEDLEAFSKSIAPMIDRGLEVEKSQVLDKFGLELAEDGAAVLFPKGESPEDGEVDKAKNTLLKTIHRTSETDTVDELVAIGLRDWEKQMDPMLQPILDLAEQSADYEQFEKGLDKVLSKMNSDLFVKRLASTMFTGHGLGDATDKV